LGNWAFALLLPLGIFPNAAKLGAMAYNQHRTPFLAWYHEGKLAPYVDIAGDVARDATPDEPVLCSVKQARIMTFLTDRRVMEEGEYLGGPADEQLLVLLDPADTQLSQWLSSLHISTYGQPLASVARANAKNESQPPLLLLHGRHE
jgi:hypothetical protein